jgi:hypothetical protein
LPVGLALWRALAPTPQQFGQRRNVAGGNAVRREVNSNVLHVISLPSPSNVEYCRVTGLFLIIG